MIYILAGQSACIQPETQTTYQRRSDDVSRAGASDKKGPFVTTTLTTTRCALYRWFDANSVLLYAGITERLSVRGKAHARDSGWMRFAVRSEAVMYPSRADALVAEREAIQSERPIFNIQHSEGAAAAVRRAEYIASHGSAPTAVIDRPREPPRFKDACRHCVDIDDKCMIHDPVCSELSSPRNIVSTYTCHNGHWWTRGYSIA
jgi:hypothetical protein